VHASSSTLRANAVVHHSSRAIQLCISSATFVNIFTLFPRKPGKYPSHQVPHVRACVPLLIVQITLVSFFSHKHTRRVPTCILLRRLLTRVHVFPPPSHDGRRHENATVRDLWAQQDLGRFAHGYEGPTLFVNSMPALTLQNNDGPTLFVNSDAFMNTAHLHIHVPLECSWYDSYQYWWCVRFERNAELLSEWTLLYQSMRCSHSPLCS
jgi:hypothetical protein